MLKKTEHSYGIIALRKVKAQWQMLLVKHGKGHWAFPKGHAEKGETPQETASRELLEETALCVINFLDLPSVQEHYFFRDGDVLIEKVVTYFFALVSGKPQAQELEIEEIRWLSIEEAENLATFEATKKLCRQAKAHLTEQE